VEYIDILNISHDSVPYHPGTVYVRCQENSELEHHLKCKIIPELQQSSFFRNTFDIVLLHPMECCVTDTNCSDEIAKHDVFSRLFPIDSERETYKTHDFSDGSNSMMRAIEVANFLAELDLEDTRRLGIILCRNYNTEDIAKGTIKESDVGSNNFIKGFFQGIKSDVVVDLAVSSLWSIFAGAISFTGRIKRKTKEEIYASLFELIKAVSTGDQDASVELKRRLIQLPKEKYAQLLVLCAKHMKTMTKEDSDEIVRELVEPQEIGTDEIRKNLPPVKGQIEIVPNSDGKELKDDGKYLVYFISEKGQRFKIKFDSKQGKVIYIFYLLHTNIGEEFLAKDLWPKKKNTGVICNGKPVTIELNPFQKQISKIWQELYCYGESEAQVEAEKVKTNYSDMRNKANDSIRKCILPPDDYKAYEIQGTGRNVKKFINIPANKITMPENIKNILKNT
jgi:hypothetical protein